MRGLEEVATAASFRVGSLKKQQVIFGGGKGWLGEGLQRTQRFESEGLKEADINKKVISSHRRKTVVKALKRFIWARYSRRSYHIKPGSSCKKPVAPPIRFSVSVSTSETLLVVVEDVRVFFLAPFSGW